MKTLFTNEKAIAIFSCSNASPSDAIRLHIYNYDQSNWNYDFSFIIEHKSISPECITSVQHTKDNLVIYATVNNNKLVHSFNYTTREYKTAELQARPVANPFSSYVSKKISSLSQKLNLPIKMPQLNSFF